MNAASAQCIATSQIQIAQNMHGWDGRVLEDCARMPPSLAVRRCLRLLTCHVVQGAFATRTLLRTHHRLVQAWWAMALRSDDGSRAK